jgi:hypothetical protein
MNEIINKAINTRAAAFLENILIAQQTHTVFSRSTNNENAKRIAANMATDCARIATFPRAVDLTFSQRIIAFKAACDALGISADERNRILTDADS